MYYIVINYHSFKTFSFFLLHNSLIDVSKYSDFSDIAFFRIFMKKLILCMQICKVWPNFNMNFFKNYVEQLIVNYVIQHHFDWVCVVRRDCTIRDIFKNWKLDVIYYLQNGRISISEEYFDTNASMVDWYKDASRRDGLQSLQENCRTCIFTLENEVPIQVLTLNVHQRVKFNRTNTITMIMKYMH